MRFLHSADWHLDSPLSGRTEAQTALLRQALLALPGRILSTAKEEGCDLVLLSGDIFDGQPSAACIRALHESLQECALPVFIAPGNHDPYDNQSVWSTHIWPENVHVFTGEAITSLSIPELNCRVYGAAFTGMETPSLLDGFHANCEETYALGVLHGDPTQLRSPYNPITTEQVRESGLDYLALGHIHKGGSFRAGNTLCAWPGCPQGRGFDELGEKGILIVDLDTTAEIRFLPLAPVRFFDMDIASGEDAAHSLASVLPPVSTEDVYRITLTGESEPLDAENLRHQFAHIPNLELRDRTTPPLDIWGSAGDDTLEGVYFGLLRTALDACDGQTAEQIRLAARISRQILSGQEVVLP